jgi:hypothetical protein
MPDRDRGVRERGNRDRVKDFIGGSILAPSLGSIAVLLNTGAGDRRRDQESTRRKVLDLTRDFRPIKALDC